MVVGWLETDQETADVLRDAEEGDVISVDFLSLDLTVRESKMVDMMSSGGLVKIIGAETARGGRHRLLLWIDAEVRDADELLDWEFAVKNKRWRKRDKEWQNNSDAFTSAELVEKAKQYELQLMAHTVVQLQADDRDDAWEKAKDSVSPGRGWTILDDVQAGDMYVEEIDDGYEVTLTAVSNEKIRTTDDPDEIDHSYYSNRAENEFRGTTFLERVLDEDGYEV